MRAEIRTSIILCIAAGAAQAQRPNADGPMLCGVHADPIIGVKGYVPSGSLRIVGWDRDSVAIRGRVSGTMRSYCGGRNADMKFGVEPSQGTDAQPTDLVAYVPRGGTVSVKTVDADITATDISGLFYTVGGNIRLAGRATSIEAESMNGNVDLNVTTPWVKARTGRGHLLLRGAPQDADASTISGTLSIASSAILRGEFSTVSGDIHYAAQPASTAIFEFSSHSGGVDLFMPRTTSASLTLSSTSGPIENGFVASRPTSSDRHAVKVRLGAGAAQMTVRTFKGTIRLRPE